MQPVGPAPRSTPARNGPHLLDATAFWGAAGGVRSVLTSKRCLLQRRGWRHTLMAPGAHGTGLIDCGGLPLPKAPGYRLLLGRSRAERLIEQAQPDIVEAADPYLLAWSVLGATARLNVPAVAFCHSDLPSMAARLVGGLDGLGTRRGRWAARRARAYLVDLYDRFDLVVAPNEALARRLRAWGLRQVGVQPLGVDCTVFRPEAADPAWRHRLCRHLGLDPGTRLLVYSGRFAPEKNLQVLADATRLLGPGHALLAVGTGPSPPRGPGVHLLPVQTDRQRLARLVASGDAYVHAGDQETFGLGVLEAMACGTPVVVSACGGLGELARDAGHTVQRRRPQEWAEAIHASLGQGLSDQTLAALARAREHDWTVIVEQMSRRYLGLLRRHAAGAADGTPAPEAARAAQALPAGLPASSP